MSDLAEQIDALLALNAKGAVSHPVPGLAVELLTKAAAALRASPAPLPVTITDGWTRQDLAEALALLDNVTLKHINSTVGPDDDANNWRKYLADADDVLAHLSLCAAALSKPGEQG